MNREVSPWNSLRTRATAFTLAVFVLGIGALSLYTSRMLKEDMQRVLGEQQFSVVTVVANDVNDNLTERLQALETLAKEMDAVMLGRPAAVQARLDQRPILQLLFNGGVMVAGTDGTVMAEVPLSAQRVGINYMDSDYMAAALTEGKSAMGLPVMGKQLKTPIFCMGVPVRDTRGKVIGAIVGVVDLGMPSFLDKIAQNPYGKTGGYVLIAARARLVVTATDKSRVMQPLPAAGINPWVDRFANGYEGSAVAPNPKGVEMLVSGKGIAAAGWYLLATLPTDEAFSPLQDLWQHLLWATLLLTLLTGVLTWWILKRQLSPLAATADAMAALADSNQMATPLPARRLDEMGHLIGGFNRILASWTQRETALMDSQQNLAITLHSIGDAVIATDADGLITRMNPTAERLTAWSLADALGRPLTDVFRIVNALTLEPVSDPVQLVMANGQVVGLANHTLLLAKDGQEYQIDDNAAPIRNAAGDIVGVVLVFSDVTGRINAQSQIDTLAFYDPLTHLPNRRLLMDRLEQALHASIRHTHKNALLFVDLDNFKTLNDTLGHHQGDLLLVQVAQRLKTCIREGDTLAHLGSDEFVVMLEDLSRDDLEAATQAEIVAGNVLAAFEQDFTLGHGAHHSTPSIGVSLFGGVILEGPEQPLQRAELAMFQAKAAGRNTLRFFDARMQAEVSAHAALEGDLREAVQQRQFLLHYQPQVVGAGRITGAEALVRWQHAQRGMVSPAEFIPQAEENGLILPIGQWVLETACAQLAAWAADPAFAHLTMAVNVSARQFKQRDFVDNVLNTLARTRANPKHLKLELTESMLVDDVEAVITRMGTLRAHGVAFSLDDFGTGYSSLAYLKRLPLDQLKIDQGFVRNIVTDPNDAAIAKMVVVLAESMGLSVIAEGVELQAQADFLAHLDCHAYQGYFFSRPLALPDFEAYVRRASKYSLPED